MRKKLPSSSRSWLSPLLCLALAGCATAPKGFLKPAEGSLAQRQLQMRQYDTTNEEQIITSVAGVLQDLGFTLDESETKLGLVVASKQSDATNAGQVAGAVLLDMLSAMGGSHTSYTAQADAVQRVKASVITKSSLEGKKMVVRVTFQRIVWNRANQISKVESIQEPDIYQKFYDGLSKAIFLEAQKI